MTDHRCKANWVSTPLFGFRFTLQDINMKYEVIKRPLLPTMPIALTNDPPSRLRLFHSIKAKKLSMESILWINVYEVISCRLLFWKEVHWFHLRFWIAMNWPDGPIPLPTCFIQLKNKGWTFATKPWLFIIIVNIITCQSKKHTDGIWWNIRSKSTNVLATAARSQSSWNARIVHIKSLGVWIESN